MRIFFVETTALAQPTELLPSTKVHFNFEVNTKFTLRSLTVFQNLLEHLGYLKVCD